MGILRYKDGATLIIRIIYLAIETLKAFIHIDGASVIDRSYGTRCGADLAWVTTFMPSFKPV